MCALWGVPDFLFVHFAAFETNAGYSRTKEVIFWNMYFLRKWFRLTRVPLFLVLLRGFLDLCQTNGAINARYLSGHQFGPLCANKKFIGTYHRLAANYVRVTSCPGDFDQNKVLQESLSWTQFLRFNQLCCMKWHIIDGPAEMLSPIFIMLKRKKKLFNSFSKNHIFWIF